MEKTEAAPAQYKQPSRKGKKAWRKNVDVTQIEAGLDDVREQIIAGGIVSEKPSDQLFAVDTTGDVDIQKRVSKKSKPLKADEILAQRSAVPTVSTRKRLADVEQDKQRKKTRVSGKDYDRLRAIAYGGDQVNKDVVQTGEPTMHDPWAEPEQKKDAKFSFLEEKKPKKEPATLKQAPIPQTKNGKAVPAVRKPEASKSYNPNFDDWKAAFICEGDKEIAAEKQRLQEACEEAELLDRRAAAAAESESGNSDAEESAWESEWEGFSEEENENVKKKRPERKTPAQRNKIKRRKERERQEKHEAKTKAKEQQAQRIKELAKSVEEKEKAREAARNMTLTTHHDSDSDSHSSANETEEVLRKKSLGKHPIPAAPLEVVLPDELRDSLRLLKPEGNLLKDRFRNMMVQGKVESRKQIPYARKKKVTVTEKWAYKDWKL